MAVGRWRSRATLGTAVLFLSSLFIGQVGAAMDVGVGLSGVCDWGTQVEFINIMKQSREWDSRRVPLTDNTGFDIEQKLEYDENGYPLELPYTEGGVDYVVRTTFDRPDIAVFPDGIYTVLWEGDGEIAIICKGGPCDAVNVISSDPNKMVVDISWSTASPSNIIQLRILRSERSNHVRNIRFLLPGYDETNYDESQPFNPVFLHKLEPFSTIRFMDWMGTNHSKAEKWTERRPATFYTMSSYDLQGRDKMGGVAIEYIVKLLNVSGKDGWLCMPHKANDDYLRQIATYFRDNLNPSSKLYLEWSNEVWNTNFSQNWWTYDLRDTQFPEAEGDFKKTIALFEKRMFDIWYDVWGAQKNRLTRVVSGRAVDPSFAITKCDYLGADNWDAISSSGYFGNFEQRPHGASDNSTLEDLFRAMYDNVDGVYNRGYPVWKEHGDYAASKGKRYLQYEGGHHLTTKGNEGPLLDLFTQAHYDARMYDLYEYALGKCQEAGSGLFMAFVLASDQTSKHGAWGHLNDVYLTPSKQTAPKYQALLDLMGYELVPYEQYSVSVDQQTKPLRPASIAVAPRGAQAEVLFDMSGRVVWGLPMGIALRREGVQVRRILTVRR